MYCMIFLAIHRVVFVEHVFFVRGWNFVMPKITWCSVTFISHKYVIAADAPDISHDIAKLSKQLMGKISMIYQQRKYCNMHH